MLGCWLWSRKTKILDRIIQSKMIPVQVQIFSAWTGIGIVCRILIYWAIDIQGKVVRLVAWPSSTFLRKFQSIACFGHFKRRLQIGGSKALLHSRCFIATRHERLSWPQNSLDRLMLWKKVLINDLFYLIEKRLCKKCLLPTFCKTLSPKNFLKTSHQRSRGANKAPQIVWQNIRTPWICTIFEGIWKFQFKFL